MVVRHTNRLQVKDKVSSIPKLVIRHLLRRQVKIIRNSI